MRYVILDRREDLTNVRLCLTYLGRKEVEYVEGFLGMTETRTGQLPELFE